MNQSTDISIEKLSAPVEVLEIDTRASRGLRRAGIYTVAEILLAGRHGITHARNIGRPTADRIFEALSAYLGISTELQVCDQAVQQTRPFDPLNAPVDLLKLPPSTLHKLGSMEMFRVRKLMSSRTNGYGNLLGLEEAEIKTIDLQLNFYLASLAQAHLRTLAGREMILGPSTADGPPRMDLGAVMHTLSIGERAWSVLELRSRGSLGLEGIGAQIGPMSSGLVERRIRRAHKIALDKLHLLGDFLDLFEQKSEAIQRTLGDQGPDRQAVIRDLLPDAGDPRLTARPEDVERLIALVRTLAMRRRRSFVREMQARWPVFLLVSCVIEPSIRRHPLVSQVVREWERAKKRERRSPTTPGMLRAGRPPSIS